MQYRYICSDNFEYLASGSVLIHKAGHPGFPVRLAGEIFMRCLSATGTQSAILFDPCCGGAYMLTVLGLLFGKHIKMIYGSDISPESIELARANLSLLTREGLTRRRMQLSEKYEMYKKPSHATAIRHVDLIAETLTEPTESIVFQADALLRDAFESTGFKASIVITDVPYGNLTDWRGNIAEQDGLIHSMLHAITPVLAENAVVAICYNKAQKIRLEDIGYEYSRIERFQCGKRKIEILRRG